MQELWRNSLTECQRETFIQSLEKKMKRYWKAAFAKDQSDLDQGKYNRSAIPKTDIKEE